MSDTHIVWTPEKVAEFKRLLARAENSGVEEVTFEGHIIYVPYGHYLMEYVETEMRMTQEGEHNDYT